MPHETCPGLYEPIRNLGPEVVGIEIGVWYGHNIEFLLNNCPNIQRLIGIDPYTPYVDWNAVITGEQLHAARLNAEKVCQESKGRAELFVGSARDHYGRLGVYDFVFVDGRHCEPYVYDDLIFAHNSTRPGGIVAGHDYSLPGVRAAIEKYRLNWVKSPLHIVANDSWYWIK